jgi:hypothetical protein
MLGAVLAGVLAVIGLPSGAHATPARQSIGPDEPLVFSSAAACEGDTGTWNVSWSAIPKHEVLTVTSADDPVGGGTVVVARQTLFPIYSIDDLFRLKVPGSATSMALRLTVGFPDGSSTQVSRSFDFGGPCTPGTPQPCDVNKPQTVAFSATADQARAVTTGNCVRYYPPLEVAIPMARPVAPLYSRTNGDHRASTTWAVEVGDLPPCSWRVTLAGATYTGGVGYCSNASATAESTCDGSIKLTLSGGADSVLSTTFDYVVGTPPAGSRPNDFRTVAPGETVSITLPATPRTSVNYWLDALALDYVWINPLSCRNSISIYHDNFELCVDEDVSARTHNGTAVQAWKCNKRDNQQWVYNIADKTIRSVHDGRCLDEDVAVAPHNGARVQVWNCNGWPNQKWSVDPSGAIVNDNDGRCLDEDISSPTHNGTKMQIWSCNGWSNQKFKIALP